MLFTNGPETRDVVVRGNDDMMNYALSHMRVEMTCYNHSRGIDRQSAAVRQALPPTDMDTGL